MPTPWPGSPPPSSPARRFWAASRRRRLRGLFAKRTTALILGGVASALILALLGLTNSFWLALALLAIWGLIFAADMPIRQAYLNDMIPSQQRATVLSFDSLMGSTGGVVIQPVLGKAADVYSYSTSFVFGARVPAAGGPVPRPQPPRASPGGHGGQPGRRPTWVRKRR